LARVRTVPNGSTGTWKKTICVWIQLFSDVSSVLTRLTGNNWTGHQSQRARFLSEAIEYGVGNQGYTIPIRGPNGQFALFTAGHNCADDEWEEFVDGNARDLMIVAHEYNKVVLTFDSVRDTGPMANLSPRELSAMTFLAKGFSRAQAAAELSISEHTLRVYIEAARHKLGALNTTHAVARALSSGIIVV